MATAPKEEMKMKIRQLWMLAMVCLLLAVPALAQDNGEAQEGEMHHEMQEGETQEEMQAEHQMSPEQMAMMKAWEEAMTPGPEHEKLASMAGDWSLEVKSWMDPAAPPEVSQATAHREMILGGRVLSEHVNGTMMGQPFEGMGTTGYDNVTDKYWGTWIDNMGTGMMLSSGTYDADSKSMNMTGEFPDPTTGGMKSVRMVVRHESDDREVMEMYEMRGEEEVKTMEIVFTRQ
jgi:hypothetical protein